MTDTSLFDYDLPPSLIAHVPAERRGESRLMHLDRRTGEVHHLAFSDLCTLLGTGDLLVLNDTRVIPARLTARRDSGGRVEVLLVRPHGEGSPTMHEPAGQGPWVVMLRAGGKPRAGELLAIEGGDARLRLLDKLADGCWLLEPEGCTIEQVLAAGQVPLPPYIIGARERLGLPRQMPALDRERYQTVYACHPGAVAAPTAGLHFTPHLLARLEAAGVEVRTLTLTVGPGTFRPIKALQVEEHTFEPEPYSLPAETAAAVRGALQAGRRVVATGTTVVRVLEHVARHGKWAEHEGWTDLYIYPPFEFKVAGALITNFHLPRGTPLLMASAFAGREAVLAAYREAVAEQYRFYSYGDAMFIG